MHMPTGLTRSWCKLAVSVGAIAALSLPAIALSAPAGASPTPAPVASCPAVGQDSGCGYVVTVGANGLATVTHEAGVGPYDGSEDVLVGVVNDSDALVTSVELSGTSDTFGFDGDGICTYSFTGDGYCGSLPDSDPYDYEGPNNTFTAYTADAGTVSFDNALAPGAGTYFSLEEAPTAAGTVGLSSDIVVSASSFSATEGSSTGAVQVASFNDGPDSSPVTDFEVTTNWGDGSTPSTSGVITQPGGVGTAYVVTDSHTYGEEGPETTTVTVADVNLLTVNLGSGDAFINVADAPLSATAQQPSIPNATTNKSFSTAVASFTDANPTAPLSDYASPTAAVINWGDASATSDGSVSQPGGVGTAFIVSGAHSYASNGTYTITVTVTDAGGASVVLTNFVKDYDAVITCSSSPCSGTAVSTSQSTGASTSSSTGTILLDLNNTPAVVGAFSCGDPLRHAPQYSSIFSSGLAANGSVDLTITFADNAAAGAWWVPFAVCYDSPGVAFTSLTGRSVTLGLLPLCPLARPGHPVVGPCVQSIYYSTILPLPNEKGTVTEKLILPSNDPFSH
jgi:hypothetical protein